MDHRKHKHIPNAWIPCSSTEELYSKLVISCQLSTFQWPFAMAIQQNLKEKQKLIKTWFLWWFLKSVYFARGTVWPVPWFWGRFMFYNCYPVIRVLLSSVSLVSFFLFFTPASFSIHNRHFLKSRKWNTISFVIVIFGTNIPHLLWSVQHRCSADLRSMMSVRLSMTTVADINALMTGARCSSTWVRPGVHIPDAYHVGVSFSSGTRPEGEEGQSVIVLAKSMSRICSICKCDQSVFAWPFSFS